MAALLGDERAGGGIVRVSGIFFGNLVAKRGGDVSRAGSTVREIFGVDDSGIFFGAFFSFAGIGLWGEVTP